MEEIEMLKGRLWLTIIMLFLFGLVACSQESNTPGETKPNVDTAPDQVNQKKYENEAFKEVTVSELDGKIVVNGKARVFEGVFQYAVVAGNEVILQDHYQTAGAPAWGDFEITFDKELVELEGTSFELFVYSAKDGSKIDVLTIPLKIK